MLKDYTINDVGSYGCIYKLTSPSGKCYIGQSWNVNRRFSKYKGLHKNLKRQSNLYNSLLKYNPINFKYEILDLCETQIEMDNKECFYIELYDSVNNGYNLTFGGKSSGKLSKQMKENMSKAKKKYFQTHENNRKGKIQSEETKRKISETKKYKFSNGLTIHNCTGIKVSKEIIEKRRLKNLQNGRYKCYKIITPNKEIVIITKLKDFCKFYDINYGTAYAYAIAKWKLNPPNNYIINRITFEEFNKNEIFWNKKFI